MTADDNRPRFPGQRLHLVDPSAFNAGLEQAAAWHDAEAARAKGSRKIAMHQISAAAIRAMKREER